MFTSIPCFICGLYGNGATAINLFWFFCSLCGTEVATFAPNTTNATFIGSNVQQVNLPVTGHNQSSPVRISYVAASSPTESNLSNVRMRDTLDRGNDRDMYPARFRIRPT